MKTTRELIEARHAAAGSRLDALRRDVVRRECRADSRSAWLRGWHLLWNGLVAPSRGLWIGVAAAWAVILTLSIDARPSQSRRASAPLSAAVVRQLADQRRLVWQPDPVAVERKSPAIPAAIPPSSQVPHPGSRAPLRRLLA